MTEISNFYKTTIDSTNDHLKRELKKSKSLPSPSVCYTFEQTKGHGKGNREFSSNWGGLYFSYIFDRNSFYFQPNYMLKLSLVLSNILKESFRKEFKLKWVNDIFLDGKKCVGILLEAIGNFIIVGIGINVFNPIPPQLADIARSILPNTNLTKEEQEAILHSLAEKMYEQIVLRHANILNDASSAWLKEYRSNSLIYNKPCSLLNPIDKSVISQGVCRDFCEDGSIVMQTGKDVVEDFNIGEISLSLN